MPLVKIIMIMFISFFISLTLLFGESETPLKIYMEDKILNNRKLNWRGIWLVEYRGYNYTDVLYKTLPHRYINWETPDTFYVKYLGRIFPAPIINSQTHSRRDGSGKQMIFMDKNSIGKTFTIWGCVEGDKGATKEENFEGCTELKFKVR